MNFKDFLNSKKYNGVYVAYKVNSPELREYQFNIGGLNLPEHLEQNLHCTVIYSNKEFIGDVLLYNNITVKPKKLSLFGENNDILVLQVESPELIKINLELIKQHGFTQDWLYSPHITLVHNFKGDINDIELFDKDIELVNMYIEELEL